MRRQRNAFDRFRLVYPYQGGRAGARASLPSAGSYVTWGESERYTLTNSGDRVTYDGTEEEVT